MTVGVLLLLARLLGATPDPPCAPGELRYAVLVEPGIPEPGFAAEVDRILSAPDGWERAGRGLCRDDDNPNIAVLLAWPDTVDEMCDPMRTNGDVSCAKNGRAVINWKRWLNGSAGWESLTGYRRYLVTHEVGHVLGMGHRRCPEDPEAATPVMRQQTSRRHRSCARNPVPTDDEIESLSGMSFRASRMRRRLIVDPWERPPLP